MLIYELAYGWAQFNTSNYFIFYSYGSFCRPCWTKTLEDFFFYIFFINIIVIFKIMLIILSIANTKTLKTK